METCLSQDRLNRVRARIEQACQKSGRDSNDVKLVAVSKTHTPESIRSLAACGVDYFGESKVQELRAKIAECPDHLTWHLIGHLQSNKARQAVQLFDMIHSVDSAHLLEVLQKACEVVGKRLPLCIQVNVSGESSKFGVKPEELQAILDLSAHCPRLDVIGLMTIPPWTEDPEGARPFFRMLSDLKKKAEQAWGIPLAELSMGMSHDFEVAIEEGATMIRVGTDLFGERE